MDEEEKRTPQQWFCWICKTGFMGIIVSVVTVIVVMAIFAMVTTPVTKEDVLTYYSYQLGPQVSIFDDDLREDFPFGSTVYPRLEYEGKIYQGHCQSGFGKPTCFPPVRIK